MKGFKVVYLILALALPAFVFLFLKFFGENRFDVQPLFSEGVVVSEGCPQPPQGQYKMPFHILKQLDWSADDSLTLFYVNSEGRKDFSYLNRIQENFKNTEVNVIEVTPSSTARSGLDFPIQSVGLHEDSLTAWQKCFLFLQKPYDLLLVDKQRRIRGYYQLNNREEIDRLIVEAKIIMKQY